MAIGIISNHRNVMETVDYVFGDRDHKGELRPRAQVVGGTLSSEKDFVKSYFKTIKALRPFLTKRLTQMVVSLAPNDRELTDPEWAKLGEFCAIGMGYELYATVCHGRHIHIVASRVNLDGSVVNDSFDYVRFEGVIRKAEIAFELTRFSFARKDDEEGQKRDSQAIEAMRSRGVEIVKDHVTQTLFELTTKPISAKDFVACLEAMNIDVRSNFCPETKKLRGFSFGYGGKIFTSRSLGKYFKISNLINKGLHYDKERDYRYLQAVTTRSIKSAARRFTKHSELTIGGFDRRNIAFAVELGESIAESAGGGRDQAPTGYGTPTSNRREILVAGERDVQCHHQVVRSNPATGKADIKHSPNVWLQGARRAIDQSFETISPNLAVARGFALSLWKFKQALSKRIHLLAKRKPILLQAIRHESEHAWVPPAQTSARKFGLVSSSQQNLPATGDEDFAPRGPT